MLYKILRISIFAVALSLLLMLTACFGPFGNNAEVQPEHPAPEENADGYENGEDYADDVFEFPEITQADIDEFNRFWLNEIPQAQHRFELTSGERTLYDAYILTGNLALLEGVPPRSMVRIWLQTAIDGNFEREFALFHPDTTRGMMLHEYTPWPNTPLEYVGTVETRQRWSDLYFSMIDAGHLLFIGDDRASLTFYTETEEEITYSLRLSENGVWLIELFP